MKTTLDKKNKLIEFPTEAIHNDFEQDDFDRLISAAFSYMDEDIQDSLLDGMTDENMYTESFSEDSFYDNEMQTNIYMQEDSQDDFDQLISSAFSYMDEDILNDLENSITDDTEPFDTLSHRWNIWEEIRKEYVKNHIVTIIDEMTDEIDYKYDQMISELKTYIGSYLNYYLEKKNCENNKSTPTNILFQGAGGTGKSKLYTSVTSLNYLYSPNFCLSDIINPLKALEMKHSLRDLHIDNFGFGSYWERLIAKCDGNTYAITSCNSVGYINISTINNSFICVPEKWSEPFEIADLIIENKNIDSITIPDSIREVRLKINSCNQLLNISFLDFFIGKIIRKRMNLCIDISNCRNLHYIRFPKRRMFFTRLQIINCISLEKVHFPGDITNIENIFIDKPSCPKLKIVSSSQRIKQYAEDSNIPIEEECIS